MEASLWVRNQLEILSLSKSGYAAPSHGQVDDLQSINLFYQSSSSSCFPWIALCRARSASARPPAKLAFDELFGVPRPLPPDESCEFILTVLSRGSEGGGGAIFRVAMLGRFAGGAGGAGLALAAAAAAVAPFVDGTGAATGVGLAVGGAGGGAGLGAGAACSSRYASGAQPCTEVVMFIHSHHPA